MRREYPAKLPLLRGRSIATMILALAAYAAIDLLTAAAQTTPVQPPQQAAPQQAPATPPRQAPAQTSPPVKGATPATVLDDKDVESLLGRNIYGANGENMGRIVDVLVDRAGQLRAAIIDFGGFLGVGTREIGVDWRAIKFVPDGKTDRMVVALTRDQVRVAPEYKQGEPVVVLGAPTAPAAAANPAPAGSAPENAVPSK